MIPVALLLWRVVFKPLIDWWKGVPPSGKAVEAASGPKTEDEAQENKSVSAPEDQSQLR